MNYLKNIKYLCIIFILFRFSLVSFSSFAQTQIQPGEVSGMWIKSNSPYKIYGEITIPNDSMLIIEPGVTVEFQGHYKFKVMGRLLAIGTETDSIIFTSNDHEPPGWHGIRFENTPATNDSSYIIYCKLERGNAIGRGEENGGGAIFVSNFSKLRIAYCLITNNRTNFNAVNEAGGGGIAIAHNSSPIVENNTISKNEMFISHGSVGAGIAVWDNSHPTIMNNVIKENDTHGGGGLFVGLSSHPLIMNNRIMNNRAWFGGAVAIIYNSNPIFLNNIISNNKAVYNGGGFRIAQTCVPVMINNDIIFNRAGAGGPGYGGGLEIRLDSDPILINTIIWGNVASSGDQISIEENDSDPNFYYCVLEKGMNEFYGSGAGISYNGAYENNIETDPLFMAVDDDDYRLSEDSPCIGAGIDSIKIDGNWYIAPSLDIEGNPRPNPVGSFCDIGAYESDLKVATLIAAKSSEIPESFKLYQNYPNPFNPTTTIRYRLANTARVVLKIQNLLGQEIITLVNDIQTPGEKLVVWEGRNKSGEPVPSGIYLSLLQAGNQIKTLKLILVR